MPGLLGGFGRKRPSLLVGPYADDLVARSPVAAPQPWVIDNRTITPPQPVRLSSDDRLRMDMVLAAYRPTSSGEQPRLYASQSPQPPPPADTGPAADAYPRGIDEPNWSAVPGATFEAFKEASGRLNQYYSGTDPDTGQRVAPQHERRTDVPLRPPPISGSSAPPQFPEWPVPGYGRLNGGNRKTGEGDGAFGAYRDAGDKASTHAGIDIQAPVGAPVVAAADGVVVKIVPNPSGSFGHQVVIDHGNGFFSQSAHLGEEGVRPGDRISAGHVIGKVGRTGNVPPGARSHLHYEVRQGSALPRSVPGGARIIDPFEALPRPYIGR